MHHRNLVTSISGPPLHHARDLEDAKAGFIRVLKCGLSNVVEGCIDEESLDEAIPGSPAEPVVHLTADDPRALDLRIRLRVWYVCLTHPSPVCDKFDRQGFVERLGRQSKDKMPIRTSIGCSTTKQCLRWNRYLRAIVPSWMKLS